MHHTTLFYTFSKIVFTVGAGLLAATAAQAASYTVTTTADELDGSPVCTTGSSVDCSLREAIGQANSNAGADTIIVPAGTYTLSVAGGSEELNATGDLDITDTAGLTITGEGSGTTSIDGGAIDRVMDVKGVATIKNLTIQNGLVTDQLGGGIYVSGSLTGDKVVIQNNHSNQSSITSGGAGVACYEGDAVTFTNSTFSGNGVVATTQAGGGLVTLDCEVSISDSIFTNNKANYGGGLMGDFSAEVATFTLEDSTFHSNMANGGGAALLADTGDTGSRFNVDRSTFNDNESTSQAGGLWVDGLVHANNLTIVDNETDGYGGGISVTNNSSSDLRLAHSTVAHNTANATGVGSGQGGGIYVAGSNAKAGILSSIVASNSAMGSSGPDCIDGTVLASSGYNLVGDTTDCAISASTGDQFDPADITAITNATLADNGGPVQTMQIIASYITNMVPPIYCTQTSGTPIMVDARGVNREVSKQCDIGAVELDQTNPTVSLNIGTDSVECNVGTWVDAGATASDNSTASVTAAANGGVDTSTTGIQTVNYTSSADYDGNVGTASRSVTVRDTTTPTITLLGDATPQLQVGDTFTDEGATSTDSCDPSVSITTSGTVDTTTAGTYNITYTATDAASNSAQVSRRVTVVEPSEPEVEITTNGKYVRVFIDGVKVQQKRVSNDKQKSKHYRLQGEEYV